jgi:magnesium chelatase subunit D
LDEQDEEKEEDKQDDEEEDEKEDEDEKEEEAPDVPEVPQEFMFDVDSTPMDPDLIAFSARQRKGKGGGRGLIFSQDRGRYIKPMLPKGKVVRLAGMYEMILHRISHCFHHLYALFWVAC